MMSHHRRKRMKFLLLVITCCCYYNSLHKRSYLLRDSLLHPNLSPWRKLYDYGDPSSFLHVTGLTREAFLMLLDTVFPPGHRLRRRHRGRPWSLPLDGHLGVLPVLLGEPDEFEMVMFNFWNHTICLLPDIKLYSTSNHQTIAASSACSG